MQRIKQWQASLLSSRWLAGAVVGLTLLVLGATIYLARLRAREEIRQQLAGRDAEVLYQAVQLLQARDEPEAAAGGGAADPAAQFDLILKASRMKGVLAVRLYTADGKFANGLPFDAKEVDLASAALINARQLKPAARFSPKMQFEEVFYTTQSNQPPFPVLEVTVPLHAPDSQNLVGVAQFMLEGHSLAVEYRRLDRSLAWQALSAFVVGGGVLALAVGWAFRRLAERTASLQRANQQLALAARTSAMGAVTAHLVHGLKNPLAGLQTFVANRGAHHGESDPDWEQAAASTRRMAVLINEAVSVLREEEQGAQYELTLAELLEIIQSRVAGLRQERGVELKVSVKGEQSVSNRVANLVGLILVNLLQNAIQASSPGKVVWLDAEYRAGELAFRVRDEGPGLPADVRQKLFTPCASAKMGGSGIGLTISKQLANHLGASLELETSSSAGCGFSLRLPAAVLAENDLAGPVSHSRA